MAYLQGLFIGRDLRLNWHWHIAFGSSWRMLLGSLLGVDVAVELVVEVVVALVLQGCATSGALEALHVQVLILDAHKDATKDGLQHGIQN